MHEIEPYYNWRDRYIAAEDEQSPFYGREYNEFEFTQTIYNYYIHPLWDDIGSPTLFIKIIFADYLNQFAVIELMGEWNDCLHNDIMYLKRNVIDRLEAEGINKFILIGENVLNFHASDDSYYEEWFEDINEDGGWIAAINFRDHVMQEMKSIRLQNFMMCGGRFTDLDWRIFEPIQLFNLVDTMIIKALK